MRKILLFMLLFCSAVFASGVGLKHSPQQISFADHDQLNVVLSDVDVNRISVAGDKIQRLNGPTGIYTARNDASGAAYLTVNTHLPFTVFISTVNGHNLSLFVAPRGIIGKTVILKPVTPSKKAAAWEKSSSYQKLLVKLINGMINHQAPEGYAFSYINGKNTNFYNIGVLKPVAVFTGAHLQGIVYELINKTKKPIILKPSYFYDSKVCAVSLSQQTIAPKGMGLVFKVISRA